MRQKSKSGEVFSFFSTCLSHSEAVIVTCTFSSPNAEDGNAQVAHRSDTTHAKDGRKKGVHFFFLPLLTFFAKLNNSTKT